MFVEQICGSAHSSRVSYFPIFRISETPWVIRHNGWGPCPEPSRVNIFLTKCSAGSNPSYSLVTPCSTKVASNEQILATCIQLPRREGYAFCRAAGRCHHEHPREGIGSVSSSSAYRERISRDSIAHTSKEFPMLQLYYFKAKTTVDAAIRGGSGNRDRRDQRCGRHKVAYGELGPKACPRGYGYR